VALVNRYVGVGVAIGIGIGNMDAAKRLASDYTRALEEGRSMGSNNELYS